jgi:dTDP-4-amino-4,6-dideoxygalactose transaminase
MIKVEAARMFYRLDTTWSESYYADMVSFLQAKGFGSQIPKLHQNLKTMIGKTIEFSHKDNPFTMRISEPNIVLLFDTTMDTDEFAQFIEGFFQ